jgi:predicted  nucleic acid-binding Zn-ribbon protein
MNENLLGREYAEPNSRLARFIDEQHRLLDKYRNQILHLNAELKRIEQESDYWKKQCESSDKEVDKLRELLTQIKLT